jgi:hypothetical protein
MRTVKSVVFRYQLAKAPSKQAIMTSNKSFAGVGRTESGACSISSDKPWRSSAWGITSLMWWTPAGRSGSDGGSTHENEILIFVIIGDLQRREMGIERLPERQFEIRSACRCDERKEP